MLARGRPAAFLAGSVGAAAIPLDDFCVLVTWNRLDSGACAGDSSVNPDADALPGLDCDDISHQPVAINAMAPAHNSRRPWRGAPGRVSVGVCSASIAGQYNPSEVTDA